MGNLVMVLKSDTVTYASSVTQFDVTFTFSTSRPVGQFANGDWWVQGPVTITSITPDYAAGGNGWEVNPTVQADQGFHDIPNVSAPFDSGLIPSLPYTADSAQSIVKGVSGEAVGYSNLVTAVVLTVLMDIPAGNGAGYFRPPYIGTSKPLYATSSLRTGLLPSLSTVTGAPSLATVTANFSKCLRMDHHGAKPRWFRPQNALLAYQPSNGPEVTEAILRLMLNDSVSEKSAALIQVTQHAIDRLYAVLGGYTRSDDGHNPLHRLLAAWAAVMLDLTTEQSTLAALTNMHEDVYLWKPGTEVLWGERSDINTGTEATYWSHLIGTDSGSRSQPDPYGQIDGGDLDYGGVGLGAGYQVIVSQPWKGEVLAAILMPELQNAWNSTYWAILRDYIDRWVTAGVIAAPDTAAPFDGNAENYGVTYGPDPENPGDPITGAGRYPELDGASTDGGQNKSTFVANMWTAHRGS